MRLLASWCLSFLFLLSSFSTVLNAQGRLVIFCPPQSVAEGYPLTLMPIALDTNNDAMKKLPHLRWETDNPKIASVDTQDGVVRGVNAGGPINITVSDDSGMGTPLQKTTCSILVTPGVPKSIHINPAQIKLGVGGTVALSATATYDVKGQDVDYPLSFGLKWILTQDDTFVTFGGEAGNVITAMKAGSVTVTAIEPYFPSDVKTVPPGLIEVTGLSYDVPQFAEMPKGGNAYINIFGRKGQKLILCEYDVSAMKKEGELCKDGTMIQFVPSGTGTSPTYTMPILDDGQAILTLARPLVAGTNLYLVNLAANPFVSASQTVNDANDLGHFRTYMTLGVQITNQQPISGSVPTQSSTAGEYLEVGLVHSFFRPAPYVKKAVLRSHPGAAGVFDVRLSPVPVSAPAGTGGTGSSAPVSITSLNLLTSQQSARVVAQLAAPFWVTSWQNRYNVTTLSPLAKAGFMTLLNSTTTGTNSAGNLVTSNYSPTYSFFGFGGRLAWERIPADADRAPQMITKLDVALAKYSSLPSYLCTSDKTKLGPTTTTNTDAKGITTTSTAFSFPTACGQANGSQVTNSYISRTLAYRLDIEALAKLPNYPFVLGVMANLAQYTVGHNANIDYLNKPGNDIRIFIGFTVPLSSLGSLLTTGGTNK